MYAEFVPAARSGEQPERNANDGSAHQREPTSESDVPAVPVDDRADAQSATQPTRVQPRVAGVIAQNLNVPWGIAFLSSGAALVSERNTGRIVRIERNGNKTTLGEVQGVVAPGRGGEGGLMGIALAPGDEETLYVYYTSSSDDRLARVSLAGGRVGRPQDLLTGIPSANVHHGGRLLFAPDGSLFLSTGDAQERDTAQDRDALTGKILRLTTDGQAAPGNPFGNRTWSYGHRNIQGLAFDAQGRLWATEYGAKDVDELNLIVRGGNYGWPEAEGRSDNSDFVQPKFTWESDQPLLPGRAGHHSIHRFRRGPARSVPVRVAPPGRQGG